MKIKTSEATGPALDWAVAKCEGIHLDGEVLFLFDGEPGGYNYSTDWSQGGPIIDQNIILIDGYATDGGKYRSWSTSISTSGRETPDFSAEGPTPLIAAMRCYVTSKLGDEAEVPDELT